MASHLRSAHNQNRHYVFTVNNISQEEKDYPIIFSDTTFVKYAIWQLERAPSTGHLHIQGYAEFNTKVSVKKFASAISVGYPDCSVRSGSAHNRQWCIAYCSPSKHSDRTEIDPSHVRGPWEFNPHGISNKGSSAQTTVNQFDAVRTDIMNGMNDDEVHSIHTAVYAKYPRWIESCYEKRRISKMEENASFDHELYPWQSTIVDYVSVPPIPRKIVWIWESTGNTGKSTFAESLHCRFRAFLSSGGKKSDIARAMVNHINKVNPNNNICLFDFTREGMKYCCYNTLEEFKRGMIHSPKYDSTSIKIGTQHLICFANEQPDKTKMSQDMWDIREINRSDMSFTVCLSHPGPNKRPGKEFVIPSSKKQKSTTGFMYDPEEIVFCHGCNSSFRRKDKTCIHFI